MTSVVKVISNMMRLLVASWAVFSASEAQVLYPSNGPIPYTPRGPFGYPPPSGPTPCGTSCQVQDPNCSAPCVSPSLTVWVEADFLYWRVFEDGLDVGPVEIIDTPTLTGSTSSFTERNKDLNFEWTPGFRIGIGQGFDICGGWRTALLWTHLNSNAHRRNGCDLKAHWKLHFDMFDAVAIKDLWLKNSTSLNLIAGVRGARIQQTFHAFTVDTLVGPQDVTLTEVVRKVHSKFYGFGPLLGLEGEWRTVCGLSIYGAVGVSALFGHFNVGFHETDTTPISVNTCESKKNQSFCQAVTDFALGMRWKYCSCSGFKTEVQLGFEHHQFYKQNKMCDCGDLCFDGLVAAFTLGF